MKRLTWLVMTMIVPTFPAAELWDHLGSTADLTEVRGIEMEFHDASSGRVLLLKSTSLQPAPGDPPGSAQKGIGWIEIPPPESGWALGNVQAVRANVANSGVKPARVTLWVRASRGWDAVGDGEVLNPGQSAQLSCSLRETYPDGTPKIDPGFIDGIRLMVQQTDVASLEISKLEAHGIAEPWLEPQGRLQFPEMEEETPDAGRRVRYQLTGEEGTGLYGVLYLPPEWEPAKTYPVIVEFPGNIFFKADACWSTGRPEQCVMGYGISAGAGAIWLSLPFVDRETDSIAEAGFGSNEGDDTADFALTMVEDVCRNWGGDRDNIVLCGFSRGSIACGYIGLRNDKIAGLWKGMVGCQHYDGSRWRQSTMEDAVIRASRFGGKAIFQVDNSQEKYQPVVDATDSSVDWTWRESGLGYHSTAMFLDDRPMMQELRQWYRDLIGRPGEN